MRLRGKTRHHHFSFSVLAYVECVLGLQERIIGSMKTDIPCLRTHFEEI